MPSAHPTRDAQLANGRRRGGSGGAQQRDWPISIREGGRPLVVVVGANKRFADLKL